MKAATCQCGHLHREHASQRVDSAMTCLHIYTHETQPRTCNCRAYARVPAPSPAQPVPDTQKD